MRYSSLEKTRFFLRTPMAVAAIQIAVGIACIALSISIAFPRLGDYAFLFLAGTDLIVLGGKRE
jgi:hypothetical protein